ncbi:MAG: amino acid--tRNA ligase-related protein, partial [Myxococcota bacterium]|nr:amino acid--tRNA ligase-related protein [Myxococcota bacterium]
LFPSADSGENQAKRPIDNNLGEQAKRPIDNNLGEQAKRPIDKKLSCPSGLELSRPFERLSVRNAFLRYAEIDLWRCPSDEALAKLALERGCRVSLDWSWEDCFHAILLQCVEPHLGQAVPTFLFDYPERLGALARCAERDYGRVAERFELYAGGLELCNGFHELNDPLEQRQRFLAEAALRAQLGRPAMPLDEGLLSALSELPDCAGNALGFERVLMLLLGAEHIQELLLLC